MRQRRGYQTAADKLRRYTREFIDDDIAKDSLKHSIYRQLVETTDHPELVDVECAFNECPDCPTPKQSFAEASLGPNDALIGFHTYKIIPYCSDHMALPLGSKNYPICAERKEGQAVGKFS